MKRYTIQVRQYEAGTGQYSTIGNFEVVGTIKRVIRAEQIGNFNPIFCTYQGKRTLVHSDAGDLSDPFRREESYAQTFFVKAIEKAGAR